VAECGGLLNHLGLSASIVSIAYNWGATTSVGQTCSHSGVIAPRFAPQAVKDGTRNHVVFSTRESRQLLCSTFDPTTVFVLFMGSKVGNALVTVEAGTFNRL
jgi:hypothetical protein